MAKLDALILCGGQGTRMGGLDKGWLTLSGQSMVERQLSWLRWQAAFTGQIWISANRHLPRYRQLGVPVITDLRPGFAGPLAGIEACLAVSAADLLLVIPCDMPYLPDDLLPRLCHALQPGIAVAYAADRQRAQPLLCLLRHTQADTISQRLDRGEAGIWRWQHSIPHVEVLFDSGLENRNTPADWEHPERPDGSTQSL